MTIFHDILSLAADLIRLAKCLNQMTQWSLKFYLGYGRICGCCSDWTYCIHSSQHHTWLLWKQSLMNTRFAWKARLFIQTIKLNKGNFPFWLRLQKDKNNCCGPHTVSPRCLLGQSRFILWIKSRYLKIFCLPDSRADTLQPDSSIRADDFNVVHHTRYPFISDSFAIFWCQWYLPSHLLTCQHVSALIWGYYTVLRFSLSSLSLMQQN